MRSGTRGLAALVGLLVVLAAVPAALWPGWGWIGTGTAAVVGALWLTATLRRRFVGPLEEAAESLRPETDPGDVSAAELARVLALEYRDATARLTELKLTANRGETALAHATDGVILISADGLVEYANPAARLLLHERVLDVTQRLLQPDLERVVEQALEVGAPVSEEVAVRVPSPRPAMARAIPVSSGGCVLLLSDLSEAYRLDRVRRDFVANVSHELKTPVAGIRALAEVASSAIADQDPETAARFVDQLQLEAERLGRLVLDLLDLSRVEAGPELDREPVEVLAVLEAANDRAKPVAEAKGVEIAIEGEPTRVEADRAQLGMAIRNLVDNAVRYSDTGTIRLGVHRDDGWVAISVADEGIGIPQNEVTRIFERFYRVDKARSRATGGTGLGLAIVRHVVENHAGRVEVATELGLGSTFTIRLPEHAPDSGEGTAA